MRSAFTETLMETERLSPISAKCDAVLTACTSPLPENEQACVFGLGEEDGRRHGTNLWMKQPHEGFRLDQALVAKVDLRLVPEIDPVVLERLVQLIVGTAG